MKASAECRTLGFLCYRGSVDQYGSFQWTKLYRLQKNWVVISLPSLLIQVRKHPFLTKNIVLEISPSSKRMVLAGTSS
ncbi:hypothetical protein [Sphingobacterium sp.]|uniref:hypothetical protein n=1 Tax=Sphingobacterium sp. TaxID=341027 RepID=UPI0028AECDFC|nr:hypothetical protein [Sphingobacterium sp.]